MSGVAYAAIESGICHTWLAGRCECARREWDYKLIEGAATNVSCSTTLAAVAMFDLWKFEVVY